MSYGVSMALQTALYQHLVADVALNGLIGTSVFDEVPSGIAPSTYVTLGPEVAIDRSDKTGHGAEHRFVISIITEVAGFGAAKAVAVAVSDALHNQNLTLSRGHLVSMQFDRANAIREDAANLRRIDMRFRARIDDN